MLRMDLFENLVQKSFKIKIYSFLGVNGARLEKEKVNLLFT